MKLELAFKKAPEGRRVEGSNILLPVGALLDIPTARFRRGMKGEFLVVGGLGVVTAIVGGPNMYKSTIERFMMLSAASRVTETGKLPYMCTYDTEMTFIPERGIKLSQKFEIFKDINLFELGAWKLSDAVGQSGDEWFAQEKDFLIKEKVKNSREYMIDTPFKGKDGKPFRTIFPSFSEVDSLTEFKTKDVEAIEDKNKLGESGGNTLFMRSGLVKTRFLMELTGVCVESNHFTLLSAHIGEKFEMASGPMAPRPTKDLQHMKTTETVKGVPDKIYFLPTIVYQTTRNKILIDDNKEAEYPRDSSDAELTNIDLNLITLTNVRSKVGPTGFQVDLVVSQTEGVLPTESEFHYLRSNKGFSLNRSGAWYNSVFLPDFKFTRRSLREKVNESALLRRAINIGAELLQFHTYHRNLDEIDGIPVGKIPSPEELYTKLATQYDWNELLDTREYWTFNQYDHPKKPLSIVDLIMMYNDQYVPYWLKDKKPTKTDKK